MLDVLAVGPKFTRPACRAAAAAIDRYVRSAPDLSSKPADRRGCRSTEQTDRTDVRTDTRPFYDAYGILCGPRINVNIIAMVHCQHIKPSAHRKQNSKVNVFVAAFILFYFASLQVYARH